MKLSSLYTKGTISEKVNPFRSLIRHASKAAGRARVTPDPKKARVEKLAQEVFEKVWGDYYADPQAQARIETFKHSMQRFIPDLLKIQDTEMLRDKIEQLFRNRAKGKIKT